MTPPGSGDPGIWDVAVVGAGPAGAAAALGVLRAWPGPRPAAGPRRTSPGTRPAGTASPRRCWTSWTGSAPAACWTTGHGCTGCALGFAGGPAVARRCAGPRWSSRGQVLDARLVAAAVAAGPVLRGSGSATPAVADGDAVSAPGRAGRRAAGPGGDRRRRGALGGPRRALALPGPRPGTVAIALRGYAPVSAGRRGEQVIAFAGHAAWPAYAWSFPIGDGRANVGYGEALPGRGPGPSRAAMLERLDELLPGAADGGDGWRAHHLPLSTGRVAPAGRPVLLAGDALGIVNPLTGEGIHAAVRSGALAGLAAAPGAAGGAARYLAGAALPGGRCAPRWAGTCGTWTWWPGWPRRPGGGRGLEVAGPGPACLRRPRRSRPRGRRAHPAPGGALVRRAGVGGIVADAALGARAGQSPGTADCTPQSPTGRPGSRARADADGRRSRCSRIAAMRALRLAAALAGGSACPVGPTAGRAGGDRPARGGVRGCGGGGPACCAAPLDVLVVRKIGHPARPELGLGAVAEGGIRVLNTDLIARLGVPAEALDG